MLRNGMQFVLHGEIWMWHRTIRPRARGARHTQMEAIVAVRWEKLTWVSGYRAIEFFQQSKSFESKSFSACSMSREPSHSHRTFWCHGLWMNSSVMS